MGNKTGPSEQIMCEPPQNRKEEEDEDINVLKEIGFNHEVNCGETAHDASDKDKSIINLNKDIQSPCSPLVEELKDIKDQTEEHERDIEGTAEKQNISVAEEELQHDTMKTKEQQNK